MSRELRHTLIAAFVFAVLSAGAAYLASNTKDQRDAMIADNTGIETEVEALKAKVAEGPELKRQLDSLKLTFSDYVRILPTVEVATQEKLMKIVQTYGDSSQVTIQEVFVGKPKSSGVGAAEFDEIPLTFRIHGTFDQVVKFMNLFEQHEPFLKINTFTFNPGVVQVVEQKEVVDLGFNIEASTYTYVPKKS